MSQETSLWGYSELYLNCFRSPLHPFGAELSLYLSLLSSFPKQRKKKEGTDEPSHAALLALFTARMYVHVHHFNGNDQHSRNHDTNM
jgi:hypothetical protein